jgi:hypothetical protein
MGEVADPSRGGVDCAFGGFVEQVLVSLAKTCSIGSRSGLQGGGNSRCAPAARIAARIAFRLWLPGLSMTATSPGISVGMRNWRTRARKLVAVDRPAGR